MMNVIPCFDQGLKIEQSDYFPIFNGKSNWCAFVLFRFSYFLVILLNFFLNVQMSLSNDLYNQKYFKSKNKPSYKLSVIILLFYWPFAANGLLTIINCFMLLGNNTTNRYKSKERHQIKPLCCRICNLPNLGSYTNNTRANLNAFKTATVTLFFKGVVAISKNVEAFVRDIILPQTRRAP